MSALSAATRRAQIAYLLSHAPAYFEDGAWLTAATQLEQAARLLREGHDEKIAGLTSEAEV